MYLCQKFTTPQNELSMKTGIIIGQLAVTAVAVICVSLLLQYIVLTTIDIIVSNL